MTVDRVLAAVDRATLPGALVLVGLAVGLSPLIGVVAAVALLGLLLVLRLPVHWLPSLALALYALVPTKWVLPEVFATLSPSALVLVVWAVRVLDRHRVAKAVHVRRSGLVMQLAVVAGVWLLLSAVTSSERGASVGWVLSFGLVVLLPAALGWLDPRAGHLVIRVLAALGGALGTFACIETWVLQANPLLAGVYATGRSGDAFTQIWGVYRATTTLGHPLLNGAFFAVALPVAAGLFLASRQRRWLFASVATAGGLAATSARGAAVAAVAGAAVTMLLHLRARGTAARPLAASLLALVALALVALVPFTQRATDDEGASSAAYRLRILEPGLRLAAEDPVTGLGAGSAAYIKGKDPSLLEGLSREASIPSLSFENSWLELLIGAGVPGLLLVVALLLVLAGTAGRRLPGPAGGIVAWMVVAASFNLLDGHRPAHMLLGALAFAVFGHVRQAPAHPPSPRGRQRTRTQTLEAAA